MLVVGQPLTDVIAAATCTPAGAIGWGDRVGTLGVGRCADVALLELRDGEFQFEDVNSQLRTCKQRLVPAGCWRAGERIATTTAESVSAFPNPVMVAEQADCAILSAMAQRTPAAQRRAAAVAGKSA